jgi:hypothetical protein
MFIQSVLNIIAAAGAGVASGRDVIAAGGRVAEVITRVAVGRPVFVPGAARVVHAAVGDAFEDIEGSNQVHGSHNHVWDLLSFGSLFFCLQSLFRRSNSSITISK